MSAKVDVSKFSGSFDLLTKVVDTKKVTVSSDPQLVLSPTKDKFNLNQKAMEFLSVAVEDKVIFMDRNKGVTDPTQLVADNERFFIAKNIYNQDDKKGKIGKTAGFSYVGIYSAILAGEPDKTTLTSTELIGRGLMVSHKTESGTSYIATKKVTMDLVPIGNLLISKAEDANPQPVFLLTNLVRTDYTPQEVKAVAETAEVAEEVTE